MNVDGKAIPLNAFTQEIIGNVAASMAQSLHGVSENWKTININIEKQ